MLMFEHEAFLSTFAFLLYKILYARKVYQYHITFLLPHFLLPRCILGIFESEFFTTTRSSKEH